MPAITYTVPEHGDLMFRTIVNTVARDIARRLELPEETIFHIRSNDEDVQRQAKGSLETAWQKASFTAPTKMTVQAVREWPMETRMLNRIVRPGTPTVFLDDDINFAIKPDYRECKVSLNISLRFRSFSEARQWRAIAERRMNSRLADEWHELEYHYPLPMEVLDAICQVYDRKYSWVNPKPETLREYLDRCLTKRATTIVNQAGLNETTVIREVMTRVVGSPEFINGDINEPEPDQSIGTYAISLQYTFHYSSVDGITMVTPQIVHNQLMPQSLVYPLTKRYNEPQRRLEQMDTTRYFLDALTTNSQPSLRPDAQLMRVIYPEWDEFIPKYVNPNHSMCVSVLILLDTTLTPLENRALLKLDELGDWEFKDYALDYLRENYQHITTDQQDVFYINVYKDDRPEFKYHCHVTDELQVILNGDPEFTSTYRIAVNLFFDLGILPREALERLRMHYDLTVEIFRLLYPESQSMEFRQNPDDSMNKQDFDYVIKRLTEKRYIPRITLGGIIPFVSFNSLIAERRV
jgi:hypothetical protein